MRLFLFRHADAAPGMPDEARPITDKGYTQIDKLIRHLDFEEFEGLAALEHSPLVRAAQTAEHFRKKAGMRQSLRLCDHIKPDDDPHKTAAVLALGDTDRMLIGHNPHHELLAGILLGQGKATVQVAFRKAAMMALERYSGPTRSMPYGYWQLRWFVIPRALD